MTSFVLITDSEIVTTASTRAGSSDRIRHVSDLATIALHPSLEADDVWIMPGTQLAQRIKKDVSFWADTPGWKTFRPYDEGANGTIRRDDTSGHLRREITIHGDVGAWDASKTITPASFLAMIVGYSVMMQIPCGPTPGATGLALLKDINGRYPQRSGWLRPLGDEYVRWNNWPQLTDPAHVAQGVYPLYPFVHCYDKNAAHMAASTSRTFGSGDPVRVTGDAARAAYTDTGYGYWCVTADAGKSLFNGDRYPDPFVTGQRAVVKHWCATPYIKSARMLGWNVTIHHGLVWKEAHDIFDEWVATLWRHRMTARSQCLPDVEELVKKSFNMAKGTFSHPPHHDQRIRWSHRPDWGATIVAEHSMRQLHQIRKFAEATATSGRYVALETDKIWWASNDPNPTTAIPDIFKRQGIIGAYKPAFHTMSTFAGEPARAIQTASLLTEVQAISKGCQQ